MSFSGIGIIDPIVIAVYLIGITAFGIWIGYRRDASSTHYFLANKSMGWFTVGAAVFTSNISTLHLVGLAAGGAEDGLVIGNFEWMACFTLVVLALIFAPFYINSRVATLPEFMERRYCPEARMCLAVIGILGALLIHIGISLFAAATIFQSFLGIPMIYTIVALSLFTVTYTALGGLKAVVMTENIQVCLLLGGALLLTVLGLMALPQYGITSWTSLKEAVEPGQLSMLRPVIDDQGHLGKFSWLAVLLGYPILGIWYWCADQTHVQRVLAAKSLQSGQNGAIFAGFLKILPVFLMVLPGVIGYAMWKHDGSKLTAIQAGATGVAVGKIDGEQDEPRLFKLEANEDGTPNYNSMLPQLVNHLIPVGLKGLLAAGMAAALMSCMAAALNSCATLISMDIVKRFRPTMADVRVVTIGRVTTGIVMLLAMAWSTQGDQFKTIFDAINKIPMTFAPAVTTVFVLGVMWKRGTAKAAMATLYLGSLIGIAYFVLDLPSIGKMILGAANTPANFGGLVTDPRCHIGVPFMLVGPILAAVCVLIYVVTSLLTPAMDPERLQNVCWDHPLAFLKGPVTGLGDPRIVSLILATTVAILYYLLK